MTKAQLLHQYLDEFVECVTAFNRSPIGKSNHSAFYWRSVVLQGFSDDFREIGFCLAYKMNTDGTVLTWTVYPVKDWRYSHAG